MLVNSNIRGKAFEDLVGDYLNCLQEQNPGSVETTPGAVEVKRQVKVELHDKEIVIPDFELICRLDHMRDHYLIECQDRESSSQEIVHKIRHIKSLSDKNNFLFVYRNETFLTEAVRKALDNDGIIHYNLDQFVIFLLQLNTTMAKLSGRLVDKDKEFSDFQNKLLMILIARTGIFDPEHKHDFVFTDNSAFSELFNPLKFNRIDIEKEPVKDSAMLSDRRG